MGKQGGCVDARHIVPHGLPTFAAPQPLKMAPATSVEPELASGIGLPRSTPYTTPRLISRGEKSPEEAPTPIMDQEPEFEYVGSQIISPKSPLEFFSEEQTCPESLLPTPLPRVGPKISFDSLVEQRTEFVSLHLRQHGLNTVKDALLRESQTIVSCCVSEGLGPAAEAAFFLLGPLCSHIDLLLKLVDEFDRPATQSTPLGPAQVRRSPIGLVYIRAKTGIYALTGFLLCLSALVAGNRVALRTTPGLASFLGSILEEGFPSRIVSSLEVPDKAYIGSQLQICADTVCSIDPTGIVLDSFNVIETSQLIVSRSLLFGGRLPGCPKTVFVPEDKVYLLKDAMETMFLDRFEHSSMESAFAVHLPEREFNMAYDALMNASSNGCKILHGGEFDVKRRIIAPSILEAPSLEIGLKSQLNGCIPAVLIVPYSQFCDIPLTTQPLVVFTNDPASIPSIIRKHPGDIIVGICGLGMEAWPLSSICATGKEGLMFFSRPRRMFFGVALENQ